MKKNILFLVRAVCFSLITVLVLLYAGYVLTPKDDFGICSMMNLYNQEDNSIDVLAVGSSLAYADINTNILWGDYGIAAYNLCSAEQPFWISYYVLKEALKTQTPRLILLDAKASTYTLDYSKRGRVILSTYGIRGLDNRIGAIKSCVENDENALDFLLQFGQIHANFQDLTLSDFVFPPDNGGRGRSWKGFIEIDLVESHERPSLVWTSTKRNMNEREEEYARKIFELCIEKNIPILVVGMPNPDYAYDHMYYNALWAVAEEYGIYGINYNDPDMRFGLRYSSDFADWQHLNVKGSITFSKQLGADLKYWFDIPDRRGDKKYASYEECAEIWFSKADEFESGGEAYKPYSYYKGEGV